MLFLESRFSRNNNTLEHTMIDGRLIADQQPIYRPSVVKRWCTSRTQAY